MRSPRVLGVMAVGLVLVATAPAGADGHGSRGRVASRPSTAFWVGAWAASPVISSDRGVVGLGFYNAAGHPPSQDAQAYPTPALHDQSFRNVVTPHVGGDAARVRLSNRFGLSPVSFDGVFLGRVRSGPDLVPGSNVPVTFRGSRTVTVPAGGSVASDPVALRIMPFAHLAVSFHTDATAVDRHDTAQQISYFTLPGAGAHGGDIAGTAFSQRTSSWYAVSGVDVRTRRPTGAVVAFGDSITDGFDSTFNADRRWPDVLDRRLLAAHRSLSVLNAGISANAVSTEAAGIFGPSGVARFGRDVLAQCGVADVILFEGSNDLVLGRSAKAIVDALRDVAGRAQRAGVRVLVATITPRGLSGAQEQARRTVNAAIRAGGIGDAVVDFDRLMRDPHDRSTLQSRYDAGDGTHPNDAGYALMGRDVPLRLLQSVRSDQSCGGYRASAVRDDTEDERTGSSAATTPEVKPNWANRARPKGLEPLTF